MSDAGSIITADQVPKPLRRQENYFVETREYIHRLFITAGVVSSNLARLVSKNRLIMAARLITRSASMINKAR